MDESGNGLVHGCFERQRHLATFVHRDWSEHALSRRFQGARDRDMSGPIFAHHESGHWATKVSGKPASAETRGKRADGTVTTHASHFPDSFQETDYSIFRCL